MRTLGGFFRKYGWTQGTFFTDKYGQWCEYGRRVANCCLSGAISMIAFRASSHSLISVEIGKAIRERIKERIIEITGKDIPIVDYNDRYLKTKTQMLKQFGNIRIDDILRTYGGKP